MRACFPEVKQFVFEVKQFVFPKSLKPSRLITKRGYICKKKIVCFSVDEKSPEMENKFHLPEEAGEDVHKTKTIGTEVIVAEDMEHEETVQVRGHCG